MLRATTTPLRSKGYKARSEVVAGAWAALRSPAHHPPRSSHSSTRSACLRTQRWTCSCSIVGGSLSPPGSRTIVNPLVVTPTAIARPSAAAMSSSLAAAAAATADGGSTSDLWADIVRVYEGAEASGACSKTETQVDVCLDVALGVEFVLRVASALKAKPQGPQAAERKGPQQQQQGQGQASGGPASAAPPPPPPAWRNPFLPPEPELFVRHLNPDHSLVLNKFNVVAHHTIVITREFRSQAEPLYGGDLAAAFQVVQAMPQGGLAFYNCGPNSGRSQPHKHLQVVPLPFTDGQAPLAPVHGLVEAAAAAAAGGPATPLQPLELRQLPYRCYATLLPDSPGPEQLEAGFNALLHLAHPGYSYEPTVQLQGPPTDAASAAAVAAGSVSYNVLLTPSWLMLVPRRAERFGPLAPNSLAFAGTMLVRSAEELDFVRQTGPSNILAQVGEPW